MRPCASNCSSPLSSLAVTHLSDSLCVASSTLSHISVLIVMRSPTLGVCEVVRLSDSGVCVSACGTLFLPEKRTIKTVKTIMREHAHKHPHPCRMRPAGLLTGCPQDWQTTALLLTIPPHSRHLLRAISVAFQIRWGWRRIQDAKKCDEPGDLSVSRGAALCGRPGLFQLDEKSQPIPWHGWVIFPGEPYRRRADLPCPATARHKRFSCGVRQRFSGGLPDQFLA